MQLNEAEIRPQPEQMAMCSTAQAPSAFNGLNRRYAIPLACPSAFRFYLDHLAVPHSLSEMIWTVLARRWPRLKYGILLASSKRNSGVCHGPQPETTGEAMAKSLCLGRESRKPLRSDSLALLTCNYNGRARVRRAVSFLFDDVSPVPLAVAKFSSDPGESPVLKHEYETIKKLASISGGKQPGLVPQSLGFLEESPWTVMLESWLPGRTAYFEMRNSWNALQHVPKHFRLALEWLMAFQQAAGIKKVSLNESAVRDYVLRPLEKLAQQHRLSTAELHLIESTENLAQRLFGTQLLLVSGHGDFWSGNLVVDINTAGVIDWEHFISETLPFDDLFFFSTAYGLNYPWKIARWAAGETAFRATYLQATEIADHVRKFLLTYCNATGLSTELLQLFFPVFIARRVLEESSGGSGGEGAYIAGGSKTTFSRLRGARSEKPSRRSGMWRRFFQIYAERSEPVCFIDRRRHWRQA
ncbi:MAG: aminoglycoside phosphotransferase family protein [Acidobacteria bacterium]|nr:aminoglycoside phosphotransferase family protein [Acidobacteriota bacterium]